MVAAVATSWYATRRLGRPPVPSSGLVTVKFDQTLVAYPEVVGDFMEHNPRHFAAKCLRVVPVESYEGTAEDRDLVGKHRAIRAAASGERHALVETKQRLACRWLVFDDDLHVRHPRTQIRRQRVERVLRVLLKLRMRVVRIRLNEKRVDPAWCWHTQCVRSIEDFEESPDGCHSPALGRGRRWRR
jgi:hypothetical protein